MNYRHLVFCVIGFITVTHAYASDYGDRLSFYRWAENYKDYESSTETSLAALKHIDITDTSYLSLGGDYRWRYEHYSNQLFSQLNTKASDSILNRFMVHGDYHWENGRIFVQLSHLTEQGRPNGPRIIDASNTDFQQAFIDVDTRIGRVRLGRQEFVVGSGIITGVREGPNQRLSFDGVRLTTGKTTDWFYLKEVLTKPGAFEDSSDNGARFYGVYAKSIFKSNHPIKEDTVNLDTFWFGFERENATFSQGIGREKRHSLGFRLWNNTGQFRYSAEYAYQFGDFFQNNGQRHSIRAWGISSQWSYQWQTQHPYLKTPKIGIKMNGSSGDKAQNDQRLNTFNSYFTNAAYITEAAIFVPGNLQDIKPFISVKPHNDWTVLLGVNFLRRLSIDDGIYRLPMLPMTTPTSSQQSASKSVATLYNLTLTWKPSPFWHAKLYYVNGKAGQFLIDSQGEDMDFFGMLFAAKF